MSREAHVQFCERLGVRLPGATHLVICCRSGAELALATMRAMMSRLKLTVNDSKTRVCYLPEERFDFLGYTFGRCYSMRKGRGFLGTVPSKKGYNASVVRLATRPDSTQSGKTRRSWWRSSTG